MDTHQNKNIIERIAGIVSDVFSPIVMPTYMMAIAMWFTPLIVIPEGVRLGSMAMVALLTAIVPVASIFALMKLGKVQDTSISNRHERYIPYTISTLCYFVTYIYLNHIHAPFWLSRFYLGAAILSLLAMAITVKWKISAHASSAAGFAAAVFWLARYNLILIGPEYWVCGSILLCGMIGTSRLILNRHTVMQIFAGYLMGAGVVYAIL